MRNTTKAFAAVAALSLAAATPAAAQFRGALEGLGPPPAPKAGVAWDRWYDVETLSAIGRRLAEAHPTHVRVGSIGKSTEGRDMQVITVSDFSVGDPDKKPAYYIDGNIHSNEIQGAEFALYVAWYLAE